jgi:hypothetical protein
MHHAIMFTSIIHLKSKKFVTVNNSMSLDTPKNNISHLKIFQVKLIVITVTLSFMNVEVKYHKGNNTNFMSFGFYHVDRFLLLLLLT